MRTAIIMTLLATTTFAAPKQAFLNMLRAAQDGGVQPPVTTGLIAWYQFEESLDSSYGEIRTLTNEVAGTVTLFGEGKLGTYAWASATTNEPIHAATIPGTSYPWSVAWWMWQDWSDGTIGHMYVQSARSGDAYVGVDSASVTSMRVIHDAPTARVGASATGILASNWYHIAFVATAPTNVILYVDGVERARQTTDPGTNLLNVAEGSMELRFPGIFGVGVAQRYQDGRIDEVMVFNAALSSNEVKTIADWSY